MASHKISLLNLPTEILQQVIETLGNDGTPSLRNLHEVPSKSPLLSCPNQPLKSLSYTCRRIHCLVSPLLLRCLKADIYDVSSLVSFVHEHPLRVEHLLLYYLGNNPLHSSAWPPILAAMDAIDPSSLTLYLSPEGIEDTLYYNIHMEDEWAFDIQYQILHLQQHTGAPRDPGELLQPDRKILGLRQWSHITFNEGSSVPAYSTYEYFHKSTPTMVLPKVAQRGAPWPVTIFPEIFDNPLTFLTSFDFIAVFPYTMLAATLWLSRFPTLKHLRTQLGPDIHSRLLDDPSALGTCQRGDLWAEFEAAYHDLGLNIVQGSLPGLEKLTILDYENQGLREIVDLAMEAQLSASTSWSHDGQGLWTRYQLKQDHSDAEFAA